MTLLIQLILLAIVCTLTILITTAAFQIFQILHEFRLTLRKLNRILDHTQTLSETAARPVTAVNQFFSEVKGLVNETEDQIISETPDKVITPPHTHMSPIKRFFRRSGLPLRPS
jgi:hypothetical protein